MIEQACILVGGQGNRLRPLTDHTPKPLVHVNGRPFLSYLLDQLKAQGIKRVLLLEGYRWEQFQTRYRLSYKRLRIKHWSGPEEWSQGERLWHARNSLDDRFLLCYGDTIVPDFDMLYALLRHRSKIIPVSDFQGHEPVMSDALITLGAVMKRPGNVNIEEGGRASYYVSPSTIINWTDVGYMIVEKEAIQDERDLPHLLQNLGLVGRLSAYEVDTQLTIDTPELLAATERALA
jgi:NDP-sugar pyrophosphorylase family protein